MDACVITWLNLCMNAILSWYFNYPVQFGYTALLEVGTCTAVRTIKSNGARMHDIATLPNLNRMWLPGAAHACVFFLIIPFL